MTAVELAMALSFWSYRPDVVEIKVGFVVVLTIVSTHIVDDILTRTISVIPKDAEHLV